MDIHKNARLTLISREELAKRVSQQGWTLKAAAAAFNVSAKTAAKWVGRYRELGREGLGDRSSRPQRSPCRTGADRVAQVEALRRERWTGLRIALTTGLSRATISRILRRLHLSRMRDLEPAPPVIRYEHAAPGDLLHLDIKKIGRFAAVGCRITGHRQGRIHGQGWEYLHVAIDDHSRIAFSDLLPNQKAASAAAFLRAAVAYYARFGICIRRVLTDNGPCWASPSASPAPTPRAPTARRNALSRPRCGSGLMDALMTTRGFAPPSFPPGCTSTTGTGRMLVSITLRPSAGLVWIGTTS